MPLANPHSIDPPNRSVVVDRRARRPRRPPVPPTDEQDDSPSLTTNNPPRRPQRANRQVTDAQTQQQWQQDHLIDLYQQLQDWAAKLDAREAGLTANSVIEEHRQRQIYLRKLRRESRRTTPSRIGPSRIG
jgi:hypothetical protein